MKINTNKITRKHYNKTHILSGININDATKLEDSRILNCRRQIDEQQLDSLFEETHVDVYI